MINSTDVLEIGEMEAAKAVDASPKKETALGNANVDNSPAALARKTCKSTSKVRS